MTKELNLTADQQAKLKPILEDQQKQIEAVWKDTSLSEDAKKAKKAEIKVATNTQIKPLLDATQREKFASVTPQPGKEAAAKLMNCRAALRGQSFFLLDYTRQTQC